MLRIITSFLLCLLTLKALPQKYKTEISDKGFDNPVHFLFYNGNGQLLDVSSRFFKKPNWHASFSDTDLKNVRSIPFDFLDDKIFVNAYFRGTTLYLFATDKKQSLYQFHVNPENFTLIGAPDKIFSSEDDNTEYRYSYSADSTYFSVLCRYGKIRATTKQYDGLIYGKSFSEKVKFSFGSDAPKVWTKDINFLVSPSGAAAVTSQVKTEERRKKNEGEKYFEIVNITKSGEVKKNKIENAIEGDIQKINWAFEKDNLSFIGLTGESEKTGYRTIVSGVYNPASSSITPSTESVLNGSKQKASQASTQDIKDNGIPTDAQLKMIITLHDSSKLLIYDKVGIHTVKSSTSPTGIGGVTSVRSYSYSENTFVLKLGRDKQIEWFHTVGKQQLEMVDMYLGIVCLLDDHEGLHILFHDHPSNEEVFTTKKIKTAPLGIVTKANLVSVYITKDGLASKSIIQDNGEAKTFMMPSTAYRLKNNEVIFTAYTRDKDEPAKFAKIVAQE